MKRAGLLLVFAALGVGCRGLPSPVTDDPGPPRHGGNLVVVGQSDVDHLSSTSAYFSGAEWLERAFTRQLVAYPPAQDYATATTLVADLAREVPTTQNGGVSGDGRTYTFHLREGVRWSTEPPREVVAGDFVRAFKLFCNPVSPVGAPLYYSRTIAGMSAYCDEFLEVPATVDDIGRFVATHEIAGVRAPDDHTLVIELSSPATDFLNLVAMPFASPVPEEYLAYLPDGPEFRRHTLSCGPYAISRYRQNERIEFERNPVWDRSTDPVRSAYVDRIQFQIGVDSDLCQLQIEAGTADLGFDESMKAADLASLRALGDPRVSLFPGGDHYSGMDYVVINM